MRERLWIELNLGRYIVTIVIEPFNEGESAERFQRWKRVTKVVVPFNEEESADRVELF